MLVNQSFDGMEADLGIGTDIPNTNQDSWFMLTLTLPNLCYKTFTHVLLTPDLALFPK
jgi:hypothetical protein